MAANVEDKSDDVEDLNEQPNEPEVEKQEVQEDAINGDLSESDDKDSVGNRDESTDEGIAASDEEEKSDNDDLKKDNTKQDDDSSTVEKIVTEIDC